MTLQQLTIRTFTFVFILSVSLVGITGCDSLSDSVDDLRTQEVDMDLGEAGQVPLAAGSNAQTDEVDGSQDIPGEAFEVKSLTLSEEAVSYEPAPGKAQDSGTAEVFLIVERVPIVGATLTIEDNEVTAIAPQPISIGGGLNGFADCLTSIDGGDDLYDDGNFDNTERESTLRSALQQDSFSLTVAACVSDDLNGGHLSINEANVEVEIGG